MANQTHEEKAQSNETEKAAVGSLLISPDCWQELPEFSVEHCYSDRNRAVLMSITRLRESGAPIDAVTISEDLANHGALSDIGGAYYINELMESVSQTANFTYYAQQVIDRRKRSDFRKLLERGQDALADGESIEKVLLDLEEFNNSSVSSKRFEFVDAKGLANGDYKQEYIIPGVLAKGQPCIIAGPKKSLKTNLLLLIAFCIATANMLFGKFKVSVGLNVGIMSGESGPGTIQETFNRIVKSFGWSPQFVDGLHFCFELPSLQNQLDIAQIKRFIKEKALDVFIFDPAYLCLSLGDGASNLFSVGEKLKPLTDLGRETGCTIILVHHTRKSNGQNAFSEPELEEIAFAGFQEWARQWILLNRREAYKPDEPGVHKLWFVAGGSAGHSQSWALDINEGSIEDEGGRIWETHLFPAKEARAEKRTEKEQQKEDKKEAQFKKDIQKVVDAIESFNGPCVASDIKNKAAISYDRTRRVLLHLVDIEAAEEVDVTRGNSQKYPGYQLTRNHSERLGIPSDSDCPDTHSEYSPPVRGSVPSECVSESVTDTGDQSIPSGPQYDDSYFTEGF